jgi:urease gamma subunit
MSMPNVMSPDDFIAQTFPVSSGQGTLGIVEDTEPMTKEEMRDEIRRFYQELNAREQQEQVETASTILANTLKFYGIDDPALITDVKTALAERRITGASTLDDIGVQLRESESFRKRFAANELRRAANKPVFSVTQLLQLESQYRQVLRNAGLEEGFYDQPNDFEQFIVNDVSPDELQDRVQAGYRAIREADPTVVNELRTLYGLEDNQLAAFFIDPVRSRDQVVRAARAAEVAAQARQQAGIQLNVGEAETLVRQGINQEEARQGFAAIGFQQELLGTQLQGEEQLTQEDIISGTFGTNQAAAQRIETRRRRRRATFEQGGQVALGEA